MSAALPIGKKYRAQEDGADLVRGEGRKEFLAAASRLRAERGANEDLTTLYDQMLAFYWVRILDNLDLDRFSDFRSRAALVARALIDRGDARAFVIGRQIIERLGQPELALTQLQGNILRHLARNRSETSYVTAGLIVDKKDPRGSGGIDVSTTSTRR